MPKKIIYILCFLSLALVSNIYAEDNRGVLTLSIPVKLNTLNPIETTNAHTKFTLPLIFEPLVTINANQELEPKLAKSWRVSSDKKTIIIDLAREHRFSDGTYVTADNVISSFQRLCSQESTQSEQVKGLVNCHKYVNGKYLSPQIFKLDLFKVKFLINSSPTTFLYQLSSPNTVITKKLGRELLGSGPYIASSKSANTTSFALTRNHFYNENNKVKNDGIILLYANGNDLKELLQKNLIDGALMYEISSLNTTNNTYRLINANPNITQILVLNNQIYPFNKTIVRNALSAAIYNNFDFSCVVGSHKAYGIIPNGIGGSLANLTPTRINEITPEEVFVAVPQLKNHRPAITIHQFKGLFNHCESLQIINLAKKYNIDVTFSLDKDYSQFLSLSEKHQFDGFVDMYIFKNREAYNILEFFSKNGKNDANISDSNIDKNLEEAVDSPTSHLRFQSYRKLAQHIQSESIVTPLFYMDHGNLLKKCLTGVSNDFLFNPFSELTKISKNQNC